VVEDSWVVEDTSVVAEVAEAISHHGNQAALPVSTIAEVAVHWGSSSLHLRVRILSIINYHLIRNLYY